MTESTFEQAQAVSGNLASLWNGGAAVLDRIARASGDPDACPWSVVQSLGPEGIDELFAAPDARALLTGATESLRRYLASETWFDRALARDSRLAALQRGPVAYFCAEFGVADWLNIYSGGLGVLAGDMLKEASDMGLPFVGVGLFYREGFFHQRLDQDFSQTEYSPVLDPTTLPLTLATDAEGAPIVVQVPVEDRFVAVRIWTLKVGRVPLFLLDTDVPENERADDRAITTTLYGGDQEMRIRQEIVLGIGGVRAVRALGIEPTIFSMNEGHAAFLGLELLADGLAQMPFEEAARQVRNRVVYTNHTVVPAGNDVFPLDLVARYLCAYAERRGIPADRLMELGDASETQGFSMPILAFKLSGKANAVSDLHAQVIPREWPGFPVEAVTNGVHVPTWVGPEIEDLLNRYLPDWRGDEPDWKGLYEIPDAALAGARDAQRRRMVAYANTVQSHATLDPEALTIVWARRFAEYKRAWLLAKDLGRLAKIMGTPDRPVQLVISGKAHPKDQVGKTVLHDLLHHLQSDPTVGARVAFLEDYSLRVASYVVQGADIWLNTPRKPLEASGTSGMKAGNNGSLQLTVTDGWAAEVDWYDVGWGIQGVSDDQDAEQLYWYLEDSVVPTFYDRDEGDVAHRWADMEKRTMEITLSRYSARRMVLDYLNKLYLPLVEEQGALVAAR